MSQTLEGGQTLRSHMIERKMNENPGISRDEAYELYKADMRARASNGGKRPTTGGFKANPVRASEAGKRGGSISKHRHKYLETRGVWRYYRHNDTGEIVRYRIDG